jgi:hypothetical protein
MTLMDLVLIGHTIYIDQCYPLKTTTASFRWLFMSMDGRYPQVVWNILEGMSMDGRYPQVVGTLLRVCPWMDGILKLLELS